LPRTGDEYSLPAGTAAVSSTLANSSHVNSRFSDLEAEQNLARPVSAGGTGATDASGARTNLGLAIGTNVQGYDAALGSLAGLSWVADRYPYTTGADTFAMGTITAAGRALLDDADAAAQLVTLGAQAADATLTSLSGLSLAEGDILYATGADTLARLAAGSDGQALVLASGVPAWETPATETYTSVITLSGTPPVNVSTTIPAGVSYIEMWFNGVSLTSTGPAILVQLGDTAFVTSGYESSGQANGSGTQATSGFIIRMNNATQAFIGVMRLRRTPGTNIWIEDYNGIVDTLASYLTGAGRVTLPGPLERIRITASGVNDFDGSGTVYAVYR
jgi:hypothetical protein